MKKILILIPYFFPGFRSGGPQQTIKNIIDTYGEKAEFYIYTQNHDYGCDKKYENIKEKEWLELKNAKIMYVRSEDYCGDKILELYNSFDTIYSCGLFEKITIKLLLIHRKYRKEKNIYIAPMGVFSEEALKIKWFKKYTFLKMFKWIGMFKNIIWSFTTSKELNEATMVLGKIKEECYLICEDLPRKVNFEKYIEKVDKYNKTKENTFDIIFLSRISPKKNLLYCIEILKNIDDLRISFDIYGVLEDKKYWELCEKELKNIPDNISVKYCGELFPEETVDTFSKYDIFLFPTKGENYGHVIYESMAGGCIPIISDKTPWNSINSEKSGDVIALDDIDGFVSAIKKYENDSNLCKNVKLNSINYAKKKYLDSISKSGYLMLIE